jgi:O-antigen ligase
LVLRELNYLAALIALLSYFAAVLTYFRIFYILVALAFCLCLYFVWNGFMKNPGLSRQGRPLLIFFVYLGITAFWAEYPVQTLTTVAVFSIFLVLWALFFLLKWNYDEFEVIQMFRYVPYVVAITYTYLGLRFGGIRPYDLDTADSIGATANSGALWLIASLPFIICLVRGGDKRARWELVLACFLIAVSESRAGYLLAVFCFVADVYLHRASIGRFVGDMLKYATLVLALVGFAWCLPVTRPLIVDGFSRAVLTSTQDAAAADIERLAMFQVGWSSFLEHPLWGVGYDNVGPLVEDAYGVKIVSHNILITLIAEAGWPGFILFVWMMWTFFKRTTAAMATRGQKNRGFYQACIISMVVTLAAGMAHPLLGFPMFYVVLGLGYAAAGERATAVAPIMSHRPVLRPA